MAMLSAPEFSTVHASSSSLPNIGLWSETYQSPIISDPSIAPNSTISVDINATDAPAFNGYDLTLFFDPTILQTSFIQLTGLAFIHPFVGAEDVSPGQIRLAVVNVGIPFDGGSGILARISFKVIGRGVSPLTLAAPTMSPSIQAWSWTQLVAGLAEIQVSTSDGHFSNVLGNPGPVASFTFTPVAPRKGDTITFNATSSYDPNNPSPYAISQYRWDFGDGVTTNSSTPIITHIYQSGGVPYTSFTGNFSVRLTVVDLDDGFEGMIAHPIQVSPPFPLCKSALAVVHVPGDCPTIQAAIMAASEGATVQVAPGVYHENPIIFKSLTLLGSGADRTTIDGEISASFASNVTIEGFRVFNTRDQNGAGILFIDSPFGVITDNLIVGQRNSLSSGPYGIKIQQSPNTTIRGNKIQEEAFGISLQSSPASILRSNIMDNNTLNFGVLDSYAQNIDSSNLVDGRPIFYGQLTETSQIPNDAGYIGIFNAHDLQIGPFSTANVGEGILVVNSTRIKITQFQALKDSTGIRIINSSLVSFTDSVVTNADLCNGAELLNTFQSTVSNNTFLCNEGVGLSSSSNNTIIKNTCTCNHGLSLYYASGNTIAGNVIEAKGAPVTLVGSTGNQFIRNQILGNSYNGGLLLVNSPSNMFLDNAMIGGLSLYNSPNNMLRGNHLNSTFVSFEVHSSHSECYLTPVSCRRLPDYIQNIDQSNTINNKPIYYLVNQNNMAIPANAGFVAIVNSTNILVHDASISHNFQNIVVVSSQDVTVRDSNLSFANSAIFLWNDENLTITNNRISNLNNGLGIELMDSKFGIVSGNTLLNSSVFTGIDLTNSSGFRVEGNYVTSSVLWSLRLQSSTNNILDRNTITGTLGGVDRLMTGIFLDNTSTSNLVVENTIARCFIGISAGDQDVVYRNNFVNDTVPAIPGLGDTWNSPSGQGNYWSGYKGQDTDNSGVGETLLPYIGLDNYPLTSPWKPSNLNAQLTGRGAWASNRIFHISKMGTAQTIFAQANNTSTSPEWVQVIFTITTPSGSTLQIVSQMRWVQPGGQVKFSASLPVSRGTYGVSVTLRYSSDAYLGWTQGDAKTFSFKAI
ncbi:right-handed parallel beta-helix repeat-containing protein [Candidatus Bathyarchaeota archaeon]|nr:right-handed parallel beta-helix repeat-containing protein [Candidatus Bathyarchaeota archaeon]